jgi:DHA2 family multidrug resistance protein-like MFS transporter
LDVTTISAVEEVRGSGSRRWWAVGALALSVIVVGLDATVLSLALPTLSTALDASTSQLQWFLDAYTLVLAALLLPAGLLGDRLGRKRLLLAALVVFGAASAACAYAPSAELLIAARSLLGLGAAMLIPLTMAVLPVLFSEQERSKAVSMLIAANVVGYPIGPLLGGWLLTHFWWGSVFLINVPVSALALIAVAWLIPESKAPESARLDPGGIVLSSLGLVGVTYGAISAGEKGWGDPESVVAMAMGLLVLGAFALWERRVGARGGSSLVDLGLFRSIGFRWGTILSTVVSFAMFGLMFAMPQYFQAVLGVDAQGAGIRLLPVIGGLILSASTNDRLAARGGAKLTIGLGFVITAGGIALGAGTSIGDGSGFAAIWMAIAGLGLGLVMPAAMDAAIGALSAERSGVGSALIMAVRMVGATIGVAVLGTILNAAYRTHLDAGQLPAPQVRVARDSVGAGVAAARQFGSDSLLASVRAAYVHGMDRMLAVSVGLMVAVALLAFVFMPRRVAAVPVEAGQSRHERHG